MKAIVGEGNLIDRAVVLGGVSLVFWTLTIQTTLKYVLLVLRADNKGEGGIFSLYSLVRRRQRWLMLPGIAGRRGHAGRGNDHAADHGFFGH